MKNKDLIIDTTIKLIEEGNDLNNITIREIAQKCNIATGLVNYHFSSKEDLIKTAVEKIVNGIIFKFNEVKDVVKDLNPFDKLEYLGNLTLDYLFSHYEISKISVLSDIKNPKIGDNTFKTYISYFPLIKEIKPNLDDETIKMLSLRLIFFMQQCFIRNDIILNEFGIDLKDREQRKKFHHKSIIDILGVDYENYSYKC